MLAEVIHQIASIQTCRSLSSGEFRRLQGEFTRQIAAKKGWHILDASAIKRLQLDETPHRGTWVRFGKDRIGHLNVTDWDEAAAAVFASCLARTAGYKIRQVKAGRLTDEFSYVLSPIIGRYPKIVPQLDRRLDARTHATIVSTLSTILPFDMLCGNPDMNPSNLVVCERNVAGKKQPYGYRIDYNYLDLDKRFDARFTRERWLMGFGEISKKFKDSPSPIKLDKNMVMESVGRAERVSDKAIKRAVSKMARMAPEVYTREKQAKIFEIVRTRRAQVRKVCSSPVTARRFAQPAQG